MGWQGAKTEEENDFPLVPGVFQTNYIKFVFNGAIL